MSGENQELRAAGLKVTVPRIRILQILEDSEQRHLAAEEIYRQLLDSNDDVGLATVYRVLPTIQLKYRVPAIKVMAYHQPGALKLGQHPVHRCQAHIIV